MLERFRDVANNVADSAPVVVEVGTEVSQDSPDTRYIVLGADGTVLVQQSGSMNGGDSYTFSVQSCTLAPAAYFEGCLTTPDWDCVEPQNWYTECVDAENFACPG